MITSVNTIYQGLHLIFMLRWYLITILNIQYTQETHLYFSCETNSQNNCAISTNTARTYFVLVISASINSDEKECSRNEAVCHSLS